MDLLDKHSEDYDPERFLEIADDQRKRDKESALDAVIPPARQLHNPFTGEFLDRDDLPALKKALAEIDEFIDELYGKHRAVFFARGLLRLRVAELKPVMLPRRSHQTEKQQKIDRCPRCKTRLPQTFIEESE